MAKTVKLAQICPVFLSGDVEKTTAYYTSILGFSYAKHFDKADKFSTVYRDSVEIVIVQKKYGTVESNGKKYGNGYDAYIDTDTLEGIDVLYEEYKQKGVTILREPGLTDYGSYEFVFGDIDGRSIGVGLIADEKTYFSNSDYNTPDAEIDKGRETGFGALRETGPEKDKPRETEALETARLVLRPFCPED